MSLAEDMGTSIQRAATSVDHPLNEFVIAAIVENLLGEGWLPSAAHPAPTADETARQKWYCADCALETDTKVRWKRGDEDSICDHCGTHGLCYPVKKKPTTPTSSVTVTDELVERGAEAVDDLGLWPRPEEHIQEFKERVARAVLSAAFTEDGVE